MREHKLVFIGHDPYELKFFNHEYENQHEICELGFSSKEVLLVEEYCKSIYIY